MEKENYKNILENNKVKVRININVDLDTIILENSDNHKDTFIIVFSVLDQINILNVIDRDFDIPGKIL